MRFHNFPRFWLGESCHEPWCTERSVLKIVPEIDGDRNFENIGKPTNGLDMLGDLGEKG